VTTEASAGLISNLAGLPAWTLDDYQLADLEMLLSGAFAPLAGFMSAADAASVAELGALADGTTWPVPVTLDVPAEAVPPGARRLVLNDPEGVPLAVLDITGRAPAAGLPNPAGAVRAGRHARLADPDGTGLVRLAGR